MAPFITPVTPFRQLTESERKPEILKPKDDERDKPLEFELSPRDLELAERTRKDLERNRNARNAVDLLRDEMRALRLLTEGKE